MSYRVLLGGLAGVLLALAAFGVTSALRTSRATQRVSVSTGLSRAYQQARFARLEEEAQESQYRLDPSRQVRAAYYAAAKQFTGALGEIARIGAPADRVLTRRLIDVQRPYQRAASRLFAAEDAGRIKRVVAIDSGLNLRYDRIENQIVVAAAVHHQDAARSLQELRGTERSVLTGTLLVFAVGLLLLGSIAVLLGRVNRQLARQARDSEHNALHDALTGLPNRVLFADRLEHAILAARRDPAPLSVLMIDLDRFKEINDTLGHSTGDQVLCEIGPRLTPMLRPGDTLARLGGDEFMVLLPAADTEQAKEITDRVLTAMREPFALGQLTVTVDASVGIVTYPTHGQDAETLVQRADVAMYLAKKHGHDAMLYDPTEDPYDPARLTLSGDLRDAINDGELELYYQPKFAASDLHLVGVEALVRWAHPTRGQLPPGDFVPLAEHIGLIRPLTLEVLRKAARQWRSWHQDGIEITIAVNLSVANLLDNQLIDDIARVLREERMPAEWLVLEITESTIMTEPHRTIAMLQRLAAMNIQLSIDDYGTGHSSLAYMRRLPVHELKIDRSFVQHLAVDDQDLQIVRSTIDLGHSLGLRVVAEGIEDARALALLKDHGCDLVQGFHLGRPAPPAALHEQLRNTRRHIPRHQIHA